MMTTKRFCFVARRMLTLILFLLSCFEVSAHQPVRSKLSPWLRQLVAEKESPARKAIRTLADGKEQEVCAFVRISSNAKEVLSRYHCQELARSGNIFIANIPLSELEMMAGDRRVSRIEASPLGTALLDSMSTHLNAIPVYAGQNLPQAYTGKGVVVGIMDIGFDLTQPNFFSRDLKDYRIKCLWDMLSTDTLESTLPVGRDYVGTQALLDLQHSRDGNDFTHGTYTLGVAAGSGYDSPYQGMAPESDIALVANAVSNNKAYIDPDDYYKFTFALNALGFKYIFDYAQSVGKPCVISLSEGSSQDFWGYDQLYYEMLDSLMGPGRIIVAAAGNEGHKKSWMHKERGVESRGSFIYGGRSMTTTLKSADDFQIQLVFYEQEGNDTLLISSKDVLATPDSLFMCNPKSIDSLEVLAYPSCYNPKDICYDVTFYNSHSIGLRNPLSIELLGREADIELWRGNVTLADNELNPQLNAAEISHNIHSPSSAPRVICAGAVTYRNGVVNAQGDSCVFIDGEYGRKANMSSTGPTMDGRIKPDVMAPGINVISSYSSYYIAAHPEADDARWNVAYYDFNGQRYAWNCNSGTSSSSPAVAGAIALWLQAKPDLKPEEALGVIVRTSKHNDPTLTYPNNLYGNGQIDAYHGLTDLLGINRIEEVMEKCTPVRMGFNSEGRLQLILPETLLNEMSIAVFQLNGHKIMQQSIPAGTTSFQADVPQWNKGEVCVISLNGYSPLNGSMLVRK